MDFNEARDDGVAVASAGPMQIICTLLQYYDTWSQAQSQAQEQY